MCPKSLPWTAVPVSFALAVRGCGHPGLPVELMLLEEDYMWHGKSVRVRE